MSNSAKVNLAEPFKLFISASQPCSYLPGKQSSTLFVEPSADKEPSADNYKEQKSAADLKYQAYVALCKKGFRRSGKWLYRPHCSHCDACISLRIPVLEFTSKRRHRRIIKANSDLKVKASIQGITTDRYQLYAQYIQNKHSDGDMFPPSQHQYCDFLLTEWPQSLFYEFRLNEELVAVSVVDLLQDAFSAVYTFYQCRLAKRSLGTFAILWLIEEAKRRNMRYLYLGYWVKGCKKMDYKTDFSPYERLIKQRWEKVL